MYFTYCLAMYFRIRGEAFHIGAPAIMLKRLSIQRGAKKMFDKPWPAAAPAFDRSERPVAVLMNAASCRSSSAVSG